MFFKIPVSLHQISVFHKVYGFRSQSHRQLRKHCHIRSDCLLRLPDLPLSLCSDTYSNIFEVKGNSCGNLCSPNRMKLNFHSFCHIVHWNHHHFLTDYQWNLSRQPRLICWYYNSTAPLFCQYIFQKNIIFLFYFCLICLYSLNNMYLSKFLNNFITIPPCLPEPAVRSLHQYIPDRLPPERRWQSGSL